MRMRSYSYESGFTLLEILIAMAVGLVLLTLLSQSLSLVQSGFGRVKNAQYGLSDEIAAIRILEQAIIDLQPPIKAESTTTLVTETDRFEFDTLPVQSSRHLGRLRGTLSVEHDAAGLMVLVLDLKPATYPTSENIDREPHVLLRDLADVSFAYRYRGEHGLIDRPANAADIPVLVMLDWLPASAPGDRRSLVMRPRLSIPGGCYVDQVGATCRE